MRSFVQLGFCFGLCYTIKSQSQSEAGPEGSRVGDDGRDGMFFLKMQRARLPLPPNPPISPPTLYFAL